MRKVPPPDRLGSVLFRTKSVTARQFPVGSWSMYVDEGDIWGPWATHDEFLFMSSRPLTLVKNNYTYDLILPLDIEANSPIKTSH